MKENKNRVMKPKKNPLRVLLQETEGEWLGRRPEDRTLTKEKTRELPYPRVKTISEGQREGKTKEFPGYIALEVTNVCNIKCTHCNYRWGVSHYTRPRGFMDMETVEKALTEVKQHNAAVLMNYDGEPLMNKRFIDYLKIATDMGISNHFNSNGTLWTKKFTDKLVKFYKGCVFFSLDGKREWFEKVRLGADYDKVLTNIEYFLKVNEENGSPIDVGISLCNLGQTAEEREAFLDAWLHRVNFVSMGEVNDKGGTMISEPMTTLDLKKRPACTVPWQTLGVCHNGDVIPCSIYITRANTTNAIFGNIYESSMKDIWHGEGFTNFRKRIADGNIDGMFCQTCERWRSQFIFPDVIEGNVKIKRNGYWTTYHNMERKELNPDL